MKNQITLILLVIAFSASNAQVNSVLWRVDNLSQIGGNNVEIIGNPMLIDTEIGKAVAFNGIDDGLIVDNNPVAGASEFTIEILFNPYSGGGIEQRFLHLQQDDNNRILIELRNNNNANWSLDTFIKSGSSNQALLDYSFTHDLDKWIHVALVFKNGAMTHYVNRIKELEGTVDYQVVTSGKTSLGVRLNKVSWFKGAIHSVKVTNEALNPEDFMDTGLLLNTKKSSSKELTVLIFPNPMTTTSQLNFRLKEASNLSIKILNIQGKEISNIFEGFKLAGPHELQINRNNLNAGIYFLVINRRSKPFVQKMIITN